MTSQQFHLLLGHPDFIVRNEKTVTTKPEVIETHISYIILMPEDVYKIKKTCKLSFLDFSTLALRQHYCAKELMLNRRLAPHMYLAVLPIKQINKHIYIDKKEGTIIDYALHMKRMDNRLEMDKLLQQKQVTEEHIRVLAQQIAQFHLKAPVIRRTFQLETMQRIFNRLEEHISFFDHTLGTSCGDIVRSAVDLSNQFLQECIHLMQYRSEQGYVRDGHGDLHSKNIFLTDPPTIFDCIEFDDQLRQIDLLNDIAFFCMDLEAYGATPLSKQFYWYYLDQLEKRSLYGLRHDKLFLYFKLYRANVRAKVLAIQAESIKRDSAIQQKKLYKEITRYLRLMDRYRRNLEK